MPVFDSNRLEVLYFVNKRYSTVRTLLVRPIFPFVSETTYLYFAISGTLERFYESNP